MSTFLCKHTHKNNDKVRGNQLGGGELKRGHIGRAKGRKEGDVILFKLKIT